MQIIVDKAPPDKRTDYQSHASQDSCCNKTVDVDMKMKSADDISVLFEFQIEKYCHGDYDCQSASLSQYFVQIHFIFSGFFCLPVPDDAIYLK